MKFLIPNHLHFILKCWFQKLLSVFYFRSLTLAITCIAQQYFSTFPIVSGLPSHGWMNPHCFWLTKSWLNDPPIVSGLPSHGWMTHGLIVSILVHNSPHQSKKVPCAIKIRRHVVTFCTNWAIWFSDFQSGNCIYICWIWNYLTNTEYLIEFYNLNLYLQTVLSISTLKFTCSVI